MVKIVLGAPVNRVGGGFSRGLYIDYRECIDIGIMLDSWGRVVGRVSPEYMIPRGLRRGSREHSCYLFFTANMAQGVMLRKIKPAAWSGRILWGEEALWHYSRRLVEHKHDFMLPENILRLGEDNLYYIIKWAYPGIGAVSRCVEYWLHNSRRLLDRFGGDPAKISSVCGNDARIIVRELRMFKGIDRKLSSLIFRLMYKAGYWSDVKNPRFVEAPVDMHLIKLAFRTGMVRSRVNVVDAGSSSVVRVVENAYRAAAESIGSIPIELNEAAWYIGRFCCSRKYNGLSCGRCPPAKILRCPFSRYCGGRCPLSGVCEKITDLKIIRGGSDIDPRGSEDIMVAEELVVAIQKWLDSRGCRLWVADWPIDSGEIDYIGEAQGSIIAVDIVQGSPTKLRRSSYRLKLDYMLRVADEPYIATDSRDIASAAASVGLGVLLYERGGILREVRHPLPRKDLDIGLRRKIIKAMVIIERIMLG